MSTIMEFLFNVFVNLRISDLYYFLFKIVLLPVICMMLVALIQMIWLALSSSGEALPLFVGKVRIKSIVFAAVILCMYWPLLIYFNGLHVFEWTKFPYSWNNTYVMLTPLLLSLGVLSFILNSAVNKTKNLL